MSRLWHYRSTELKRPFDMLAAAKLATTAEDYMTAANRSYYALFSAMRAVLALDFLDFKKHSAVIGKFRELYVKTGVFEQRFSDVVGKAFIIRNNSDYEDFYLVSREDTQQQIEDAAVFIEIVRDYLDGRINAPLDSASSD